MSAHGRHSRQPLAMRSLEVVLLSSMLLAFAFSVGVGVLAGLFPAVKAAISNVARAAVTGIVSITCAAHGFKVGDVVTIAAPEIGALVNEVVHCQDAEPWTFGTGALMASLARRGVLRG